MDTDHDYANDAMFHPDAELKAIYEASIQRLQRAFKKDLPDKEPVLDEAREELTRFTPAAFAEKFGLGSNYSLVKEFHYETLCANASAVARILVEREQVDEAKAFCFDLYDRAVAAGFTRDSEFLCNRIDSRTFVPMRRHIDRAYLERIGYRHLDNVLLCVGDCQTVIMAEMIRDRLALPGVDIASYQHALGSLIDSPLEDLFRPAGYLFFVNCAADYALLGQTPDTRETYLDIPRKIVAWLKDKQPRVSTFVTHVYFGADNAIEQVGSAPEAVEDAVGPFSDEVAEILAEAPNAHLINFQEICPFTRDKSVFRDDPDAGFMLHFDFPIMDAVGARVVESFRPLNTHEGRAIE